MPRTIDTPIIISQLNRWEITAVHIYLQPAPRCVIEIARGYVDGEEITTIDVLTHEVAGETMLTAMQTPTSGGAIYTELKAMLYARCVADGIIPAEAVDA